MNRSLLIWNVAQLVLKVCIYFMCFLVQFLEVWHAGHSIGSGVDGTGVYVSALRLSSCVILDKFQSLSFLLREMRLIPPERTMDKKRAHFLQRAQHSA